jgi:hypothetical protein
MIDIFILLAALAASPADPGGVSPAAAPAPRITAQALVDSVRPHLPREFSHGTRLVGASADGSMVVMDLDVPPALMTRGADEFERSFLAGFCTERKNIFFDNGIAVRFDVRTLSGESGRLRGTVYTACPALAR